MGAAPIDLSAGLVANPAPAVDLSAGLVPKAQSAPVARLTSPGSNGQSMGNPAAKQGFLSSFADGSGLTGLAHAVAHPLDTIAGAVRQGVNDSVSNVQQGIKDYRQQGLSQQTRRDFSRAIPVLGPVFEKAKQQEEAGNEGGAAGTVFGLATGLIAPGVINKVPALQSIPGAIGDAIRAPLTRAADEVIPGTSITPRARYAAAQRLGVNLDLADATNHPALNAAKSFNRDSLLGSGVYDKAKASNISTLGSATDATLNSMSPLDREAGGARLQGLLKEHQASLKADSDAGHSAIQSQYGDSPLANPGIVANSADAINAEQARSYSQFPSLRPGKTAAIVDDASRFGRPVPPITGDVPDAFDPPTVGDALKARSRILDVYRNNPDIVKTEADSQLQRLVGATHESVMDSLPAPAQKTLRDAQLSFKAAKEYDNNQSPYYDAIRTTSPSTKVTGIGPATPESVRDLVSRVGPEGQGIVQRGVTEKLLGTDPGTGGFNFKAFPRTFANLPDEYGKELLGGNLSRLQDISDTSQALSKDFNPSGSAKQGQKVVEAVKLATGVPLLQYPLARLINSPAIAEWAMRQPAAAAMLTPSRLRIPAAASLPLLPQRTTGTGR